MVVEDIIHNLVHTTYGEIGWFIGVAIASLLIGVVSLEIIKRWIQHFMSSSRAKKTIKKIRIKYYVLIVLIGLYITAGYVDIDETIVKIMNDYVPLIAALLMGYLVVRVFDGIIYEILYSIVKKTETKLDDMLLPIVRNTIYLTVFLVLTIIVLAKMGYDVSAFVASLGVGGLAIAMASQQILQNFFGGIIILVDGTFRPGDRVIIKGYEGTIEGITLRTTKIRKDDGSVVKIPNSIILKEAVTVKGP